MEPGSRFALDRRTLLIGGGAGAGLLIAWSIWPREKALNLATAKGETALNAFLKIGTDNHITIAVPQAEMGQGIWTALPQVLADALGADWRMVGVEPAPIGPDYANFRLIEALRREVSPAWLGGLGRRLRRGPAEGDELQATIGSNSMASFHDSFQKAGNAARVLLCKAAAEKWDTDWHTLQTRAGHVVNGAERIPFGALAEAAARQGLPSELPPPPEPRQRLAGRSLPRLDAPPKVDGSARFGADVRLPNLTYASVRSGPPGDSVLLSADMKAAQAVKGVITVIRRDRWVAAVGDTWWTANRALNVMKPRFRTNGTVPDSATIDAALSRALDEGDDADLVSRGKPDDLLTGNGLVAVEYAVPMIPHASLETPSATVRIAGGRCELWVATQSASIVQSAVADAIGYAPEDVIVYPTLVGGGFGRMLDPEVAVQAAIIAQEVKRPVQLVWSRFEEMVHDAPRPAMRARMRATISGEKKVAAWEAVIAAPDYGSTMLETLLPGIKAGPEADGRAIEGAAPPYAIPALKVTHRLAEIGPTPGIWRSGTHSATCFFTECFIDELAAKAGLDPLTFRLRMLEGQPRHAEALKTAAGVGGYAPFAGETAQGIAVHESAGSVAAVLAEVSLTKDQGLKIGRLVCAVDCGRVINPDLVRQQVEGGMIFALAGVLKGGWRWTGGLPEPRDLGGLHLPLMADTPEIEVHIVASDLPPAGVSGVAVPPVAPALANAIFAATGKRIRTLPFEGQALS